MKIEYYNEDKDYKRNADYYISGFYKLFEEYQKLWDNKFEVNKFTDILIDNDKLPIHINEYFSKNALRLFLHSLVAISQKLGTWESYKRFFTILFGDDVDIRYTNKAGHIIYFSISNIELQKAKWINELKDFIITHNGEYIVFADIIKGLNADRTNAFLNYISPFYEIVYFQFNL